MALLDLDVNIIFVENSEEKLERNKSGPRAFYALLLLLRSPIRGSLNRSHVIALEVSYELPIESARHVPVTRATR